MPPFPRFPSAVRHAVEPLWPAGLALLLLAAGHAMSPYHDEGYDWLQYLMLGTVYPLALLGAWLWGRRLPADALLPRVVKTALALGPFLVVAGFLLDDPKSVVVPIAAAQGAMLLCAKKGSGVIKLMTPDPFFSHLVVAAPLLLLCWWLALRWGWWLKPGELLVGSRWFVAVVAGALSLTAFCFARLGTGEGAGPSRTWLRDLPAFALLLLASAHVHRTGFSAIDNHHHGPVAHHHWGAVVGPAHLVREGGHLLWDVPSQYGFLNTLLVAKLPVRDVWQAAFVVNTVLNLLVAALLFRLWRSLRAGPTQYALALLVAVAAPFLLPGEPRHLTGPFITPAVGPFRFFWCHVLLALLVWDYRASQGRRALWLGCVAWLFGAVWSAESAVYCSVIWLPAFVVLALRQQPAGLPWSSRLFALVRWLAVPPLLLATAIGPIALWYRLALGHGPDWYAYLDYCFALRSFAIPINPNGAVGLLLLVLCALATAAWHGLRGDAPLRDLPPLLGACGVVWACSSYFVGRSDDLNVTNLAPLVAAAVAATLHVLARPRPGAVWPAWVRLSLAPVVAVMLIGAFWHRELVVSYAVTSLRPSAWKTTTLHPHVDEELRTLLAAAGAGPDAAIVFLDNNPNWLNPLSARYCRDGSGPVEHVRTPPAWLPAPLNLFIPLPEERRQVYLARFAERSRRSGWLVRPNEYLHDSLAWLLEGALRTHVPVRSLTSGKWTATYFEYALDGPKGTCGEGSFRPQLVWFDSENGIERWNGGQSTWVGRGPIGFGVLAADAGPALLTFHTLPGPNRPDAGRRTVWLTGPDGTRSAVGFDAVPGSPVRIPLTLPGGCSRWSLACTDEPTALMPEDPRTMLFGMIAPTIEPASGY